MTSPRGPVAQVVELVAVPVPARPGHFRVLLPDGCELLRATRQPLFDGARALAARGVAPETIVVTRHRGSPHVAMRSTVGEAARWTVEESDRGGLQRRLWRPHWKADSSQGEVPETRAEHRALVRGPPTDVDRCRRPIPPLAWSAS